MKRHTFLTFLFALVTMTGQAQTKNYTIRGNLSEVAKATAKQGVSFDSVTIMNIATNEVISKQTIQDGVFTINGTIEKPFYALLCIWSSAEVNGDRKSKKSRIPIIIEPGDIMFDGNRQTPLVSGTPLNDMLSDVISKRNTPDYTETLKGLAIQHKDDVAAIPLLLMLDDNMAEPEVLLSLINQSCAEVQNNPNVIKVKENLLVEQETEVGRKFKGMKGISPDGKPTALSDYVGKGNYVLADFWASWCIPCRHEIPEVIALHEKYEGKGLKVIGITVHDSPEKSDKVVEQMRIPFPQIYESKPMSIYGVLAIPYTILFAPDGTILARGPLPMVEKLLKEIFKDK